MKPRKSSFFRICALTLCLVTFTTCTGCQKSPESSIVVNKDLDKLIEEANTPDAGKVDIKDISDIAYETYVTSFEDASLGVKVNVDAKVDIPKAEHLSVFRVKQVKFTQDFIDRVRSELMGDAKIFDGAALAQRTKKDIAAEIAAFSDSLETLDDFLRQQGFSAVEIKQRRQEIQNDINSLRREYENAPNEIDITSFLSDGKLHTNEEMYQKYPEHYAYEYESNPTGDACDIINDGSGGMYSRLSVEHSENNGNILSFYASCFDYSYPNYSYGLAPVETDKYGNETIPDNFQTNMFLTPDTRFAPTPGETCELSVEEAVTTADAFLEKIGLGEFVYYSDRFVNVHTSYASVSSYDDTFYYSPRIILTYYRNIDGVLLTQSSGTKNNMSIDSGPGAFTKKSWGGETITVAVNDSGIVEFIYNSPIEIIETVAENTVIKSFEDVRETFEKMMIVTKASQETIKVYDIERVRLSYSRISEPDSYDTGLIVPVWDFYGHYIQTSDGIVLKDGNTTALAINAIDGSIIDPDLGY